MNNVRNLAVIAAMLIMAVPAVAQDASDQLGQNPFAGMSPEQRREAFDNMSDAEREQMREQMRNNPDARRERRESMTPEQRENMRKRFESMSPEQRQQMRERLESRGERGQRGDGSRGGKRRDI